jgi:hypothetical protein
MSQFIQALELRVLLSATADTLTADQATIDADAKAVKAALDAGIKAIGADSKTIAADLKGATDKTTAKAELKTLLADEKSLGKTLKKDEAALLKAGIGPSHKATAVGIAVTKNSSDTKLQAKLSADIAALATAAPLATLAADATPGTIPADMDAMVASNPTNSALSAHVAAAKTDLLTQLSTVVTAGTKFSTDVGTLKADLGTLVV